MKNTPQIDDYIQFTNKIPALTRRIDDALLAEDWLAAHEASVEARAELNALNRWLVRKTGSKL